MRELWKWIFSGFFMETLTIIHIWEFIKEVIIVEEKLLEQLCLFYHAASQHAV